MSLQIPVSPLTSQYSDSESYDNQFGDDETVVTENDAKYNDILNDMILSVDNNDNTNDILCDSNADSDAANQLFNQIFAKYRSNFTTLGSIAPASPMVATHVRSKSSVPKEHQSPPPPFETPINNYVLNVDDPPPLNMNEPNHNHHINHSNAVTDAYNANIHNVNAMHNIHHNHHNSTPPLSPLHHQPPPPPMPHNNVYPSPHHSPISHHATHSSPNTGVLAPPSPHFGNIQVPMSPAQTPIFNPQRSYDRTVHMLEPLPVLHQHSAPPTDYRHQTIQHIDSMSGRYYQSPNMLYKPPHYHQHSNHNPANPRQHQWNDNNNAPAQGRARHSHHQWNMSPHKHSQSVNYVGNRNNGNTVHIMYNININDANNVYSGNNGKHDSPIPNNNIPNIDDTISPFLRQSISPTSSLEEFIAKPPKIPRNDEFIPPSPQPILHHSTSAQSHTPTVIEGPKRISMVEGPKRTTTTTNDASFVPPSPTPRAYRSRTNQRDSFNVIPQEDSKEISGNSIWDDDSSSEDESDAASCSSSDSWRTKQKRFALNAFTNTVESAPKNTVEIEDYAPSHQYVIDAIFNIKKFSQKSDVALSLEEFETSFRQIPGTLNEADEFKIAPISPTSLTPSSPTTTTSLKSNRQDPNILQLKEIIWSVTNPEFTGKDGIKIRDVILLCHPIFTESTDILELLQKRFLRQDCDVSDNLHFQIQTKVTVFLRHWMMHYYYQDFELCADNQMNVFLDKMISEMRKYFSARKRNKGDTLPKMIEKTRNDQKKKLKKLGLDSQSRRRAKAEKVLGATMEDNVPLKKKAQKINDKKFWNEDNKKIAQQLTLLEFEQFKSIEPRECLCQNWKKKDKELRAPNILNNVEFFNNLSNYIAMTILAQKDAKQRAKLIRKWIKIGSELFVLHNFESLAAVQGTLTSTPIYRLKTEWKYVAEKHVNKLKEFTVIYARGKNNANLRKIIQITPPPMIPYTGIFLQDLFVIEESRTTTKKDGTINFPKLMALHGAVKRIQVLQNTKYTHHFKENKSIQLVIKEGLNRYSHLNSQAIYNASIAASPLNSKKK